MKDTILLIILITVISCSKPTEQNLAIPKEELKKVLMDVHIAEAVLQPLSEKQKDSLRTVYYDQIYKIHDINPQAYENALKQLKSDPRTMRFLYEDLLEDIEKLKATQLKKDESADEKESTSGELGKDIRRN